MPFRVNELLLVDSRQRWPLTQVTISAPSLNDCIARVEEAGGKVIEPNMPIPGIGWGYADLVT